jgi:hypothetical protein
VPVRPGLGIELNEGVLKEHRLADDQECLACGSPVARSKDGPGQKGAS